MPAETLPVIKQGPPKEVAVPDKVLSQNFSIEDFDVEQLPTQGTSTEDESSDSLREKAQEAEQKTAVEAKAKLKEKPTEKPTKEETHEQSTDESTETDGEQEEDKKDGVPKFLKPPKKDDEKSKEEGKKLEDKPTTGGIKPIVPPTKVKRDYSGYSPEQVSAFKQMSDSAYKVVTDLIKEKRELEKVKDSQYLQHPDAYVLTPEYKEQQQKLTLAQTETRWWEEQLALANDGKEIHDLAGYDPQTLRPVAGRALQPTAALVEKLRIMLGNSYQAHQQIAQQLQTYPGRYKEQITKDLSGIENFRHQQFGWVANPELLDYTMNVDGRGEIPLKQIAEDAKAMIPPYMRNHPLANIIGDMLISIKIQAAQLAEAQNTNGVKQTMEQEQELVEPSSKSKPTSNSKGKGEAVHGVKEFKIDPDLGI